MKLALVCAFLGSHGGFENNAEAIARVAVEAGHTVDIFTPYCVPLDATIRQNLQGMVGFFSAQEAWRHTRRGRLLYLAARVKHHIQRRGASPDPNRRLGQRWARDYVRGFWDTQGHKMLRRYDIVHLIGKPKLFISNALIIAYELGKRVIYTEIAQVHEEYANRREHKPFQDVSRLCDVIVAYSAQQALDIRHHFNYEGEIRVIDQWAFGLEDRLLSIERNLAGSQSADKPVYFGTLCRLGPEKGLETLVAAFAKASKRNPDIRLRIAGTGALEQALYQLVSALGLEHNVHFEGYVEDRAQFYALLDAFVVASKEEGGPITGAEAMAAGLPIITTPVGAMPDRLAPDTDALFFEVDSVDALSAAILRLAEDALLRQRLGTQARKRYCERNHSRANIPELIKLWS